MKQEFIHLSAPESSIQYLMRMWRKLNLDPDFQREGSIWPRTKQQLFIDSILCGFDIPKFYFRSVEKIQIIDGKNEYINYDVVDGKQRLLAVRDFEDGRYGVPANSRSFQERHEDNDKHEIYLSELKEKHRDLYIQFESYHFDIVSMRQVDDNTADEFFLRLNSGVALTAQEKRDAIESVVRDKVRSLATTDPFMKKLKPRARKKNEEVLAKLFAIAQQNARNELRDTKKQTLDKLYKDFPSSDKRSENEVGKIEKEVQFVLGVLKTVFTDNDPLLRSLGNISVFFYAALREKKLWNPEEAKKLNSLLAKFEKKRYGIRGIDPASLRYFKLDSYHLFEKYNSYVQSTNDGSAIKNRALYINTWIESCGDEEKFVDKMKQVAKENGIEYSDPDDDEDKGPSDAI
ncbi:DUF262 domain-containing protein [Bifidobacterium asteroides]|uniref:DUF262 domain-containing protein n=1 Tax=Bifidobacterium asteroides TaxID=1684 RepID=UPI0027422105|nr:DUF262 domain-containing protein [Bifidobacterium asteroides]WLT11346.1 DUF262 domain-containing protein [Bifidobacterium asteroides]